MILQNYINFINEDDGAISLEEAVFSPDVTFFQLYLAQGKQLAKLEYKTLKLIYDKLVNLQPVIKYIHKRTEITELEFQTKLNTFTTIKHFTLLKQYEYKPIYILGEKIELMKKVGYENKRYFRPEPLCIGTDWYNESIYGIISTVDYEQDIQDFYNTYFKPYIQDKIKTLKLELGIKK